MKIAVLGAGAWGTAVAAHLARRHDVVLWGRDAALVERMRQTACNDLYLPDCPLPGTLRYAAEFEAAVCHGTPAVPGESTLLVLAVPVAGLRPLLSRLVAGGGVAGASAGASDNAVAAPPALPIPAASRLVWLCKGFEADSGLLPHQIAEQVLTAEYGALSAAGRSTAGPAGDAASGPARPACGVLTGPSFAKEVAQGLPVALTAASADASCRQAIVDAFHHAAMRIYTSDDLVGVEVGGAVKNVLAIATGISDGLGLGLNARAALVTRGLAEITRLGIDLGARAETFTGLSGVGDLILTATGDLSRNRKVGMQLAAGGTLTDILQRLGHVAEGVPCTRAVDALARSRGVDMPITRAVCSVLFEDRAPREAVADLLQRDAKAED